MVFGPSATFYPVTPVRPVTREVAAAQGVLRVLRGLQALYRVIGDGGVWCVGSVYVRGCDATGVWRARFARVACNTPHVIGFLRIQPVTDPSRACHAPVRRAHRQVRSAVF